jgi:XTP/dITP diphosphohydrolase
MTTFVLATANPHKTVEMESVLNALNIQVLPRPNNVPDVDETEDTLEGNALLKAQALVLATGHASVADDTGLFVDALNGEPGVYSARYAGQGASDQDNVEKLLSNLAGVSEPRTARFRTVICVAYPDGSSLSVEGVLEGSIGTEPKGSNGFGYDPIFAPLGMSISSAQMSAQEKDALSHRGKALRAIAPHVIQMMRSLG